MMYYFDGLLQYFDKIFSLVDVGNFNILDLMQDMLNNSISDPMKKLFIVQGHKVILVTIISTNSNYVREDRNKGMVLQLLA